MNINELTPRHVNIEEALNNIHYDGTFAEFVDMLMNHDVTLATDNGGNVVDFHVAASDDMIQDQLIGKVFASSYLNYSYETIMEWVAMIMKAKYAGLKIEDIDEDAGTCKVGGTVVEIPGLVADESDNDDYAEELPESVEIDFEDLTEMAGYVIDDDEIEKWVKRYLRKTYKHCLARGVELHIDAFEDPIIVSGIEWGRPLTESELENLDY